MGTLYYMTSTSVRRGLAGARITKGGEVSAKQGLAGAGDVRSSWRMFYSCSCCATLWKGSCLLSILLLAPTRVSPWLVLIVAL